MMAADCVSGVASGGEGNLGTLARYLTDTLSSDATVRRAAEGFLESVEHNQGLQILTEQNPPQPLWLGHSEWVSQRSNITAKLNGYVFEVGYMKLVLIQIDYILFR